MEDVERDLQKVELETGVWGEGGEREIEKEGEEMYSAIERLG